MGQNREAVSTMWHPLPLFQKIIMEETAISQIQIVITTLFFLIENSTKTNTKAVSLYSIPVVPKLVGQKRTRGTECRASPLKENALKMVLPGTKGPGQATWGVWEGCSPLHHFRFCNINYQEASWRCPQAPRIPQEACPGRDRFKKLLCL